MITAQDLKKGTIFLYEDEPWMVIELTRSKVAMRGLMVKAKMRNLKKGNVLEHTFRSNEGVPEADVEKKSLKFLYKDTTSFVFMDNNFEQHQMNAEDLADKAIYLTDEVQVEGVFWDDKLFDVIIPKRIVYKVVSSPIGVKGDSSSSATKAITLENGMVVNAPLFIKEGEKVAINTETGEYTERAND